MGLRGEMEIAINAPGKNIAAEFDNKLFTCNVLVCSNLSSIIELFKLKKKLQIHSSCNN